MVPPTPHRIRTDPLPISFTLSKLSLREPEQDPREYTLTDVARALVIAQPRQIIVELEPPLRPLPLPSASTAGDGEQPGAEGDLLIDWQASELNAILLQVEDAEDCTQSRVRLVVRNKSSTKLEMELDLRVSAGFRSHLLERFANRLQVWSRTFAIPSNISQERAVELYEAETNAPQRIKTPPGFRPGITSTIAVPIVCPDPTPSPELEPINGHDDAGFEARITTSKEEGENDETSFVGSGAGKETQQKFAAGTSNGRGSAAASQGSGSHIEGPHRTNSAGNGAGTVRREPKKPNKSKGKKRSLDDDADYDSDAAKALGSDSGESSDEEIRVGTKRKPPGRSKPSKRTKLKSPGARNRTTRHAVSYAERGSSLSHFDSGSDVDGPEKLAQRRGGSSIFNKDLGLADLDRAPVSHGEEDSAEEDGDFETNRFGSGEEQPSGTRKSRVTSIPSSRSSVSIPLAIAATSTSASNAVSDNKAKQKTKAKSKKPDDSGRPAKKQKPATKAAKPVSQRSRQRTFSPSPTPETTENERQRRARSNQVYPPSVAGGDLAEFRDKLDRLASSLENTIQPRIEAMSKVLWSHGRFDQIANSLESGRMTTLDEPNGAAPRLMTDQERGGGGSEPQASLLSVNRVGEGGIEGDVRFLAKHYDDTRASLVRMSDRIHDLEKALARLTGRAQTSLERVAQRDAPDGSKNDANEIHVDGHEPDFSSQRLAPESLGELERRLEGVESTTSDLGASVLLAQSTSAAVEPRIEALSTLVAELEREKQEWTRREDERLAREAEREKERERIEREQDDNRIRDQERLTTLEKMVKRLLVQSSPIGAGLPPLPEPTSSQNNLFPVASLPAAGPSNRFDNSLSPQALPAQSSPRVSSVRGSKATILRTVPLDDPSASPPRKGKGAKRTKSARISEPMARKRNETLVRPTHDASQSPYGTRGRTRATTLDPSASFASMSPPQLASTSTSLALRSPIQSLTQQIVPGGVELAAPTEPVQARLDTDQPMTDRAQSPEPALTRANEAMYEELVAQAHELGEEGMTNEMRQMLQLAKGARAVLMDSSRGAVEE